MVQIMHGLPKGLERDAATLYWQAFGQKLGRLMGPSDPAIKFFTDSLNHDAVLAAMEGDQLLGIVAFKTGEHGFSSAGTTDLFRQYGLGAL